MLNLNKLEIFLAVIDAGSFSGAAEQLLMTQSGVSQHIRDLEAALGTTLFERNRRGVALTQSGRTLHGYARRILGLAAEAENAVTDVARLAAGSIELGATPGIGVYVLSPAIQQYRARYPNLTVSLHTRITPEILQALRRGRLDLGFVEGELAKEIESGADAELRALLLEPIEQFVVVGREHPFWGHASLTPAQLDGHSFIMRQPASQTRIWLDAILAQHGIAPRVVAEFDTLEAIKRAVASGAGLAILPHYAVGDEVGFGILQAIPLQRPPSVSALDNGTDDFVRTLKLVWRHKRLFSPVTLSLLRHLAGRFPALESIARV
jgi:LysR family transcriptional regulator, low CO2-responsive transcriptional regulator